MIKIKKEIIQEIYEIIIKIHDRIVELTEEPKLLRPGSNLEYSIFKALNKSKGDFNIDFAIRLMKDIAEDHPFVEGNKRTAYVV